MDEVFMEKDNLSAELAKMTETVKKLESVNI